MLAYGLLRPHRVVVITSRDAPDGVDLIGQRLVAPDRLRFQDFRHVLVDASDPLDMYQNIARELAGRESLARSKKEVVRVRLRVWNRAVRRPSWITSRPNVERPNACVIDL
ncbi:hypothetical protein [Phytohabitans suffuscus]|uniref:hypothetical protein n=1 Tax=Phytohabitans suffuscus TaxID=624315 RepID=UPI00156642F4|nr:hypothetical protein [Phytohabitans suffuscus]